MQGLNSQGASPRLPVRSSYAFALHNLPGTPLGTVAIRRGTFNCASRGIAVTLSARPSHAAHSEDGTSPALAMCALVERLGARHQDCELSIPAEDRGLRLSTIVHAELGEVAFGTSPAKPWSWLPSALKPTPQRLREEGIAPTCYSTLTMMQSLA